MQTIARNFKKNPHTARFLMTFHAATAGLPSDVETPAVEEDLLNLVPERTTTDARSPRQVELMDSLIAQIFELDSDLARAARTWTDSATAHGSYWTPGREGTASAWISKMMAENGELKFFKVRNGRRPGFVFLDIQASDDWHAIRNLARIQSILTLIAADPKAAMARYGQEIGECGRCGRVLTSKYREMGIGPVCIDK